MAELSPETVWYPPHLDEYLNRWFASYTRARKSLEDEGGYLFPYKHHFFITEWGAVKAMGLDPDDPDWALVGHDVARPGNPQAYERLLLKRRAVALKEKSHGIGRS